MQAGRYTKLIKWIYLGGDLFLLNAAFFLSFILRFEDFDYIHTEDFLILTAANISWIYFFNFFKISRVDRISSIEKVLSSLIKALATSLLTTVAFVVVFKLYHVSRLQLGFFYILLFLLIVLWRIFMIYLLKQYRRLGYNYRNVVILGAGPVGIEMMEFLTGDLALGYRFLGFLDDNPEKCLFKDKIIGKVEDVKELVSKGLIDEVFCALPDSAHNKIMEMMEYSENNLVRFRIIPDIKKYYLRKFNIDFYGNIPVVNIRPEPLENHGNRILKRLFDIVFSLFVLVFICSWLFPIIAIIIKATSKGPVFFVQKRSGKRNHVFNCYKFRSMTPNKDADSKQADKNDMRITPFGRFLRKTNLDEFPQFFNVLKGDMSVVGPRPHMLKHTEEYSKIIDKYMVRHFVKPGITGFAQINGYRGETKDPKKMHKRVQYDVWYIENWSFLLDLKIIFFTVWNMLRGDENAG